jgi:hypothetical protein
MVPLSFVAMKRLRTKTLILAVVFVASAAIGYWVEFQSPTSNGISALALPGVFLSLLTGRILGRRGTK